MGSNQLDKFSLRPLLPAVFALIAALVIGAVAQANVQPPTTVSVRLRPLKGLVSIAGENLKVGSQIGGAPFSRVQAIFGKVAARTGGPAESDFGWTVTDAVSGKTLTAVIGTTIEIGGENLRVDLRSAPNRIRLVAIRRRAISDLHLVGVLSLEDYVEGVVSAEVPRDWPLEALKAQAVAARSFTLAKLRERGERAERWQLEASVMDQVFDNSRRHEMAARAVRETRGLYLAGPENHVATTHYHSDCGGQTDEPRDVWGGGETLGTAKDMCPKRVGTNWRLVTSLAEITEKLQKESLIHSSFRVSALNIEKRSPAGRAQVVRLAGAKGQSLRLTGEKMRSLFGYMNLRSTLFEIKSASAERIEFQGRGFGHGTGLCQWGARTMAQNAKSYREILAHYYPKLTLSEGVR